MADDERQHFQKLLESWFRPFFSVLLSPLWNAFLQDEDEVEQAHGQTAS
jgi:hypothetical protein